MSFLTSHVHASFQFRRMRKSIWHLLPLLLVLSLSAQETSECAKNMLIVNFKENEKEKIVHPLESQEFGLDVLDSLNAFFQLDEIKLTGNRKLKDTYLLIFKNELNIEQSIEEYLKTELFEYVEPNYIGHGAGQMGLLQTSPNDTYYSRQYALHNDGSFSLSPATAGADIEMELAWDIEKGDTSVIVAVLDAGARMNHPEFSGRLWRNLNDLTDGVDSDGNGYVDDFQGWDFANDDNVPADDHGHGTNVAGIIGLNSDNNQGYAAVDWHCQLMICKVLDQTNSGFYTWWIDAIYYAVDNGAKVINMSLGGSGTSASMLSAVSYAHANDVVIVASMMNFDNSAVYYPVGFPTTIAVGSTDANDQRSSPFFWSATSGSSYGNHIDIVAPGNFIYGLSHQSNSNYNAYWGGTSQATPLVSGVCALLLAQNPSLTPTAIRTILRNSAEDQVGDPNEDVPGFDIYHGYGRLNAYQALLANSVGATELDELSELTVFPNPSSTELRIKAVSLEGDLRIVNMQGAVVYRQTGLKGSWEVNINIGEWPKGIYVVAVSDENGQWQKSTRIIVE